MTNYRVTRTWNVEANSITEALVLSHNWKHNMVDVSNMDKFMCAECCEKFDEKTEFETCPHCFSHKVVRLNNVN